MAEGEDNWRRGRPIDPQGEWAETHQAQARRWKGAHEAEARAEPRGRGRRRRRGRDEATAAPPQRSRHHGRRATWVTLHSHQRRSRREPRPPREASVSFPKPAVSAGPLARRSRSLEEAQQDAGGGGRARGQNAAFSTDAAEGAGECFAAIHHRAVLIVDDGVLSRVLKTYIRSAHARPTCCG